MHRLASALLISSCSLVGCAAQEGPDPGQPDDPGTADTSTTDQAVSGTSLSWHPCNTTSCQVPLGSSATQTCFLAGISGALAAGSAASPAGANIVDDGRNYTLHILNPSFGNIGVMTTCITNTANRTTAIWQSSAGATQIPQSPTSTRRCFLSGVISQNATGFSTFSSNVHVLAEGNAYFITGSLPAGSQDTTYATCVDVPNDVGDYSFGNGSTTPFFGDLNFNSGGVACGLTGVGGQFIFSNDPGSIVNYNGSTQFWTLSVAPFNGAWATCVL